MTDKESDKSKELDRDLVFYYSREKRLERASAAVRELNDSNSAGKRRSFFGSRSNTVLFVTILLICAGFGLVSRLSGKEKDIDLGNNNLSVAMTRQEGVLILVIEKNEPKKGNAYIGPVDIAVSPVMSKSKEIPSVDFPPMFTHRIFFTPNESEMFSFSVPFEEIDYFILLRTDDEQKSIRISAIEENLRRK